MPIPPFPECPSLPPNGVATTPHSLAVADSLASEALHLLNAETDSLFAKTVSWFPKPTVSVDAMVRASYARLGSVHGSLNRYAGIPSAIKRKKILADLHAALSLNPDLVSALHPLALIAARGGHDYACAEALYWRALGLEPNNAAIRFDYAELLAYQGKFTQAFRQADKAMALADAPTKDAYEWRVVRMHYMASDYDWVMQYCNQHIALADPNNDWNNGWPAHFYKALALSELEEYDKALAAQQLSWPFLSEDGFFHASLVRAYVMAGNTTTGKQILDMVLKPDHGWMPYEIAAAYEALGDLDNTFLWLHLAAGEGDEWLRWLDYDPRWKRIREDPRFNKLKMAISATQRQQPTAPKTATVVNSFSGKAKDSDRPPHIWLISNHKSAATIGWSPIHGVAEYRLVVEPHGVSAGLIQQFSLKGSVQKYRFPKLRQHGAYQIYLTALSDKGVEIKTVECTFNL